MTKYIILITIISLLFISCDKLKTIQPDSSFKLDASLENIPVYEFTPRTAPDVQCVFVGGSFGKSGLFCFSKIRGYTID